MMKKCQIIVLALVFALSMLACRYQKADPIAEPIAEPIADPIAEPTAEPTEEPTQEPTAEPTQESADEPMEVELAFLVNEYGDLFAELTYVLPAGATVRIAFPRQEDYINTNTKEETEHRKVRMAPEVFLEDETFEGDETEITPQVFITTADGREHPVDCPTFIYPIRLPSILLTTAYEQNDNGELHVQAGEDGIYVLNAEVSDPNASIKIDFTEVPVNEDGVFTYDLAVVDGAPTYYELKAIAEYNRVEYRTNLTIVVDP